MAPVDALIESELKDAFAAPGCAVCRLGERSAGRYLATVLHESVNDLATRSRLLAAWGFCRRHAWHFLRLESQTMRDELGTAILGEGLVEAVQLVLDSDLIKPSRRARPAQRARQQRLQRLRRALVPGAECPPCSQQREHEAYSLWVLMKLLGEPAWQARVAGSAGLCLPHLRMALSQAEASDEVEWLLADHRRRLDGLLADLKEYIRKHDYRFAGEPPGRERDAVPRVTAVLAGTWFELPESPACDKPQPADRDTP